MFVCLFLTILLSPWPALVGYSPHLLCLQLAVLLWYLCLESRGLPGVSSALQLGASYRKAPPGSARYHWVTVAVLYLYSAYAGLLK